MIKLIKSSFHHEAETKKALLEFIAEAQQLSMGVWCAKFEQAFAAKQNRKHAVFVSNGSVANLLLVQSLLNLGRLKKGDKVGFSALTWPTNVMPLIQLGLEPVPIDCELDTLNVSPDKLNEQVANLSALFLTNVLGFCDDLPQIKEICDKNHVFLLEDNCESLGSVVGDRLLGNFGAASTFSFFVGHHMSTIEGGMICTDDDELHEYLVMGRAHGWDRNLSKDEQDKLRSTSKIDAFYAKYTFYDLASNFRPTEINGFIGNIQVQYWDEIVNKRVENFDRFRQAMSTNDDFYQYELGHMKVVSNFSMPIVCKSAELAAKYRSKFEAALVEIRPVIAGNMTKQPFYQKYVGKIEPLPNSDLVHANGFYFGNNPEMTDQEVDTLCNLLSK
jgi:CDP-4-dehydro-6-deoxyglucose reductase, E1